MTWLQEEESDTPSEATNESASRRLRRAWHEAECDLSTGEYIKTDLLEAPVTPYSPWVTGIPVFYVTLGGNREAAFLASMGRFSHSLTRIAAVNGSDDSMLQGMLQDAEIVKRNMSREHPDADKRLGCLLSHLEAINTAYHTGAEVVLILEDDAVPLYSGWRIPLEEFVLQLPAKWQASQLQWTFAIEERKVFRSWAPNATNISNRGSGWGTAAYLLHRRAMRKILHYTRGEMHSKFFITDLVRGCKPMSADDCLLSFTARDAIRWLPHQAPMLQHVYMASPPLFVHHSTKLQIHSANICEDMLDAQQLGVNLRPSLRMWNPTDHGPRVLVFMALPSMDAINDASLVQMRQNIAKLQNVSDIQVDTFLGIDDGTSHGRLSASDVIMAMLELGKPWGRFLHVMNQSWPRYNRFWRNTYSYIWALDVDIEVTQVHMLRKMLLLANTSTAMAVSPSVLTRPDLYQDDNLRTLELPHQSCSYRYASHVSLSAPMMAPGTWGLILEKCSSCLSLGSGRVDTSSWCSFLRETPSKADQACAILDDVHVHRVDVADLDVLKKLRVIERRRISAKVFTTADHRATWSQCSSHK